MDTLKPNTLRPGSQNLDCIATEKSMCHFINWNRTIPETIRPARCTSAFGRMTDPEPAKQALPRVRSKTNTYIQPGNPPQQIFTQALLSTQTVK